MEDDRGPVAHIAAGDRFSHRGIARRARVALLVMLCAVATLAQLVVAPSASATSLPPQGLYEACYPGQASSVCAARLQQMGSAGFKVVLNYWMLYQSNAQQVLNYVQAAQNDGLQVIWPLNDLWSQPPNGNNMLSSMSGLAATCGCSTNQGLTNYIVSLAKSQPSTWGYYIADEPNTSQVSQLQAFNQTVKSDDPNHPTLLIIFASGQATQSETQPFNSINTTLGADEYPVTTGSPDPNWAYSFVAAGTQGDQAAAAAGGLKSAIALQAFNFGEVDIPQACGGNLANCRFPTEQEMWMQRNAAVLNGNPQVILWFGLFDVIGYPPGEQNPDFIPPPDPTQRWNDLVQAAFDPNVAAPPPPPPSSSGSTSSSGGGTGTTASSDGTGANAGTVQTASETTTAATTPVPLRTTSTSAAAPTVGTQAAAKHRHKARRPRRVHRKSRPRHRGHRTHVNRHHKRRAATVHVNFGGLLIRSLLNDLVL